MIAKASRNYVGFGFGAIHAGLFLYEAHRSGNFRRITVAEVVPQVVEEIRHANGMYALNIALSDRVESVQVGPIVIENPSNEADRERLIDAISEADEIGTAVPSVDFYVSGEAGSLHRVLAEGLRRKASQNRVPAVIYTAENNNHAAEILEAQVMGQIPDSEQAGVRAKVRFLNTVIAKMGGVVTDPDEIVSEHLMTVTPTNKRAYLVEAFNRIQITQIDFDGQPFERGISVFEEKSDLLPFEENKLYGHNATHALAAYIGAIRKVRFISDLEAISGAMSFLQKALVEESGNALIHKYSGFDELFTANGYQAYAKDLFTRMMNPYLRDTVERVGRNPERKLGWDDRLVGIMRLALKAKIAPKRYAFGTAAALVMLNASVLTDEISIESILLPIWAKSQVDAGEREQVLELIERGLHTLKQWIADDYPDLDNLFL